MSVGVKMQRLMISEKTHCPELAKAVPPKAFLDQWTTFNPKLPRALWGTYQGIFQSRAQSNCANCTLLKNSSWQIRKTTWKTAAWNAWTLCKFIYFSVSYSPFVTIYLGLSGHYRAMGYSLWTTELWYQSSLNNTCQGLFILQGNFHTLRVLTLGKYEIRYLEGLYCWEVIWFCDWASSADGIKKVCCALLLLNLESGKPVLSRICF